MMIIALKIILGILLFVIAVLVLFVLLTIVSSLFVNTKKTYDHDNKYYRFLIYSATYLGVIFGRIKVHVTGMELLEAADLNTDSKKRFLLVGNHRSNFDPILAWYVLNKSDLAYLSKEANMHIIAYGRIIRKCCCMVIDRENPKEAMKALIAAAELIKKGEVSYGIYPEGTRNHGNELLPFHNGVFKIAQLANVPIVEVAIWNADQIHVNFPLKKTDVYVDFLDVIPADQVKTLRTSAIGEKVREDMTKKLKERGM